MQIEKSWGEEKLCTSDVMLGALQFEATPKLACHERFRQSLCARIIHAARSLVWPSCWILPVLQFDSTQYINKRLPVFEIQKGVSMPVLLLYMHNL